MSSTKTMTALAAGVLALSAGGAAMAQTPYSQATQGQYGRAPSGSYTSSCRNVQMQDGGYVSAECRVSSRGEYRWSTIRYVDCRGDLANRSGVLSCSGATASTGQGGYSQGGYGQGQQQPGGVLGALLGAVFGVPFVDDRTLDNEWDQGRSIGERRETLEARLDAGVRDGSLTRTEAVRLQTEFDDLVRLETRYASSGGLSASEREDLRTRYRALARQVGEERRDDDGYDRDDGNGRDWSAIRDRETAFDARLDAGVRARTISGSEARRLGAEFDTLVRLETTYSADGLSRRERAELDNAYRALEARTGVDGDWDDDRPAAWTPLAERRADFDARVAAAVRARTIRSTEGVRLRAEFQTLARLETTYMAGGLSAREQTELETRYAALVSRLPDDGYGGGYGGSGGAMSPQAADIEARIVASERSGVVNRAEAARLRTELGDLVRLEASYASDGLNAAERDYMTRRYAELSLRARGGY